MYTPTVPFAPTEETLMRCLLRCGVHQFAITVRLTILQLTRVGALEVTQLASATHFSTIPVANVSLSRCGAFADSVREALDKITEVLGMCGL